ncbi:putative ceramide synthase component [Kockovaella imperatae]|uniref:Putative ceramide synthase component n=1 Tax=Kockovaella imperatae TaxID=4999 RepID=A0A1Y1UKW8_9TREE|nr:putative ceramide synthase component [Kockovaella imperatae]ORX38622.1 putative ceramide synthase component [Kockovaella imperatae]
MATRPDNRRRSSSITQALRRVPLNQQGDKPLTPTNEEVKPLPAGKPRRKAGSSSFSYASKGFWNDIKTGRWMLVPASSFKILAAEFALWAAIEVMLTRLDTTSKTPFNPLSFIRSHPSGHHWNPFSYLNLDAQHTYPNPMSYFLFPQGLLPNGMARKSWADFVFVAQHIITWSFVRQFWCVLILPVIAKALRVKRSKIMRFTEQGYAIVYFGIMGTIGVYVMKGLPTYWYQTEHFWLEYPHKSMTYELKAYYLLQAAYWVQQLLLLVARIEKPRKDFKELVAHHIVTLWLIGWSYTIYLTHIGNAIYVTMDVSDIFLALAKCTNYVNETASIPVFAFFVLVWTYFRHYLNIKILWSVYSQFHLIPASERQVFDPLNDKWMPPWMKWQIFTPILLLQFINLFWYFLILRILAR